MSWNRKLLHRAKNFAKDDSGRVSALCFKRPRAIGMDAEELWRQRQELADWAEARTRCHALVDELPVSALTETREELGELREHYEAIDRVTGDRPTADQGTDRRRGRL